jgi:DHA1 family bicyclomycin/chloramphenicol resistance-like MFS transporter
MNRGTSVESAESATMESVTTGRPRLRRRLRLALVLGSLTGLGPFSIDMYLPSLPSLARDLHASTSVAQLSLTACLLGLALGQLIAGPISDAHGRRRPLMLGLLVYALASGLCALTTSIWLLVVLRLIQGLAGAAGIVIARAIARDHYAGSELTRFFGLLMLVNGVAPILAPVAGGQLLRITSWHGVFIVLSLLGLALLTAVVLTLPESLPSERRTTGGMRVTLRTFRRLISDGEFIGYVLAQGLAFAAMFAYISGSPFVLQDLFGVSAQTFSLIFATNGLGLIISGQVSARSAMRWGERRVLLTGLGLASAASLALLAAILGHADLRVILPALFVAVASVGTISTMSSSLALQNHGQEAGSASALIGVAGMLTGAVATPVVGLHGSHTALPMGIVIVVCHLSAALCYLVLVAGRRSTSAAFARSPSHKG